MLGELEGRAAVADREVARPDILANASLQLAAWSELSAMSLIRKNGRGPSCTFELASEAAAWSPTANAVAPMATTETQFDNLLAHVHLSLRFQDRPEYRRHRKERP